MKGHLYKKFILQHAIHATIQKLWKTKQKTTNITPFLANFGRKRNTPASNIKTKPNSKNLNYTEIVRYYLDEDTILGRSYLTDLQWVDAEMCSEAEIERVNFAANVRVDEEKQKMKYEENSLMWSEGIFWPLPRSARSFQVKIAQKTIPRELTKEKFRGALWEKNMQNSIGLRHKLKNSTLLISK